MAGVENDLRGTVPSCYDILRKRRRRFLVSSGQTEITDLERAVLVQKQVRGLQISVDDVCRMHVVASGQDLKHEVLEMVISEVLSGVDDPMHVSFHQLRDDVDILVVGWRRWLGDVKNLDDVLVVKEFQQTDLSNDSLGVNQVLESLGHFLDGDLAVGDVVVRAADYTVGTVTNLLDVLKLFVDAKGRSYKSKSFS